ncbi:MAG: LysM peptidoglycan-binding domain-containing protein [Spirochaetales bacterium]|nr:LysM peptidoglycan-binding domain-containing protein [Spirochaetales bacterium]
MKKALLFILIILTGLAIPLTAESNGFYHSVVWKDTLMDISLKYQVGLDELAKINGISNWNLIFIGQKLWIPKATSSNTNKVNVYIYHVKYGDTLSSLAENFMVTIWDIASINRIYDLNRIYIGQQLYIPVN